MIKWLICLLWGHDFDKEDWIHHNIQDDNFKVVTRYRKAHCKRCCKYKRIS